MQRVRFIKSSQTPALEIVEDFVHDEFRLADDDCIAMVQRLLGHETWMHAAHDDGHASRPELVRNFIAAIDVTRHRGNPNQICLKVKINWLDVFVGEHNLVLIARDACRNREQAGKRRV